MKTLIAIGGGSFQREETRTFDELAIQRTQKTTPFVLCLPTASNDDQGYAKRFKQYYRRLGCDVQALRLFHTKQSIKEIHDLILSADIIYLGAGDSTRLMKTLHDFLLVDILKQAYEQGSVLIGVSAGANALFTKGFSDTTEGFQFVEGMDLISGVFCPHAQDSKRACFWQHITEETRPVYPCEDKQAVVKLDEDPINYINAHDFESGKNNNT